MTKEEKALELVAENRVILEPGDFPYVALVAGEHDHYTVEFLETGPVCPCPAREMYCSHALAAMIAFAEDDAKFKAAAAKPW